MGWEAPIKTDISVAVMEATLHKIVGQGALDRSWNNTNRQQWRSLVEGLFFNAQGVDTHKLTQGLTVSCFWG